MLGKLRGNEIDPVGIVVAKLINECLLGERLHDHVVLDEHELKETTDVYYVVKSTPKNLCV